MHLWLHEFQEGFLPLIVGFIVAIVLSFTMRETGSAAAANVARIATLPRIRLTRMGHLSLPIPCGCGRSVAEIRDQIMPPKS
jgi:hypothetical protein